MRLPWGLHGPVWTHVLNPSTDHIGSTKIVDAYFRTGKSREYQTVRFRTLLVGASSRVKRNDFLWFLLVRPSTAPDHLVPVPRILSGAALRPACVILCLEIPGRNGIQVQQALAGTGTPVIFVTSLEKPYDGNLLVRAVRAALGEPSSPAPDPHR